MKIIPACATLLDEIERLERECFSLPCSREWLEKLLCGDYSFLAAIENNSLAGYIALQRILDEAEIITIAVKPQLRRLGIAEGLLQTAELECRREHISLISLEVRAGNTPAIALYGKLGYTKCGVRRGYYEKPREDAIIMTKQLEV